MDFEALSAPACLVAGRSPIISPCSVAPECSAGAFPDVPPTAPLYNDIMALAARHAISGYPDGTFRPQSSITRGQLAKIVVSASNLRLDTTGGPHFRDVPQGSVFYDYIETGYNLGLWSGYPDGSFKPADHVTRGQLTKMIVSAAIHADPAHWTLADPSTATFEDVPVGSAFFRYIETAVSHGVVNGYPCGAPKAGACVPPLNKAYFVSAADATRAQASKMVNIAVPYQYQPGLGSTTP